MKFLDDIQELKEATEALLRARDELSNTMGDAARQLAEMQQAIAAAPKPRFAAFKAPDGQDVTIAITDGVILAAALCVALDSKEAVLTLEGGQTINLKITDFEQIAPQILEQAAVI